MMSIHKSQLSKQPGAGRGFDPHPTQEQLALDRSIGSENAYPFQFLFYRFNHQTQQVQHQPQLEIHVG